MIVVSRDLKRCYVYCEQLPLFPVTDWILFPKMSLGLDKGWNNRHDFPCISPARCLACHWMGTGPDFAVTMNELCQTIIVLHLSDTFYWVLHIPFSSPFKLQYFLHIISDRRKNEHFASFNQLDSLPWEGGGSYLLEYLQHFGIGLTVLYNAGE